jgi:hypothetical protein
MKNHFKIRPIGSLVVAVLSFIAVTTFAQTPLTFPEGAADFLSWAARNYWYLFGDEKESRVDLDTINREVREARAAFGEAKDDDARRTAVARGEAGSARLIQRLTNCPSLVRIDLTGPTPVMSSSQPIELPGDTGAILFEVNCGGEGVSYRSYVVDLAVHTYTVWANRVSKGTIYVLLGLEHIPFGRSTLDLELRRTDAPTLHLPLAFSRPAAGRLKLTLLSDDTGKPVPAMVHMKWRTDDMMRRPGSGIDFVAQMDSQGNSTGARTAFLPGLQGRTYWCVPGESELSLAPGRWEIGVRRGVEHALVFQDVEIRSGETTTCTVRPKRWVDMRKRGWWSGDDHVHCQLLSDDDARRLMNWVQAEDIHFANVVKMGDIYRTYFEQRGFGRGFRVVDGDHVLVPGQECPRTHDQIGHVLAMNLTSMVRDTDRYFLYDEMFDEVHRQGGLTGYAHVGREEFHVHRDMTMNVPRAKVDFVEILQFNVLGTDLYYDFLNLGCKLTASAGSDVPWGGTIGEVRAYAYLGKKKFSADAWLDAFKRGRTFTTSGPMLDLRVDNAMPGDEIRVKRDRKLRVRARAWGDSTRMGKIKLEIVRHGDVIRTCESATEENPEAELDFTVDAGDGCWIAARAKAADGTSAHTTPVYVVREGLRFWKYDGLQGLFARRLASLEEIEKIVADARKLRAEGKLGGNLGDDRYLKQLAQQGDPLLQRVAQARVMYDELKHAAESERERRASAK